MSDPTFPPPLPTTPGLPAAPAPGGRPAGFDFTQQDGPMLDPSDADVAAAEAAMGDGSPLDALVAELTAEVEDAVEPTRLDVPGRDGIVMLYRKNITGPELERWRKQAKSGKGVDAVRLSALALVHASIGMVRRGEEMFDDAGDPITFRSRFLIDLYAAPSAVETVRKLYVLDGRLMAAANAVLEAAGFGDEAVESDPT